MVELSDIKQVVHLKNDTDVNSYLKGDWVIIATAGGQDENGYPVILYSLGRT